MNLNRPCDELLANFLLELVHANIDRVLRASFYGTPQTREVTITNPNDYYDLPRGGF
jgi:hypothetical protein